MNSPNSGATPDRDNINESTSNDPCVRFVKNTEGVHEKIAMGKHSWIWEDLLKVRVCGTCGERREWTKRFQGQ